MSRQHRTQLETYDGTQTSLLPQKRVLPGEEAEGSNIQTTAKRLKTSNVSNEDKLLNFNLSMREHLQKNIQKFLKNENKLNEFRRKLLSSTRLQNNPEEIDRNFSFSGTDNGIVKMTETVPLNLERFNYHLRLHNRYSPLAYGQEPTDDAEELPFIPLPKPLTVNAGDIDFGGGHWRLRRKLEREKRMTGVGQLVTQIERNLVENDFSKAITVQETERAYREQIVSREQLREFYGSRKRAAAKRKVEILDYKFRNHLCTQERKKMKEGNKHLVMFVGDRGTGVGSTIKGYRRYGGTWKQEIHGRSTTTCITNENKTSQTCFYCFHPLSHPKQKAMVKGKIIQKSINGSFICYNQACVSVRNNRNVQTRDSVSAMAIGLSGLATILFNQTFPQFATILSQSNTDFRNKTDSFLTRSGFRAS